MVFFSEDSSLEEGTDFVADEGRPRVTPQSGRGAGTWAAEGGRSIAHRQRRCRRRDGVERQEEPPWRWCPSGTRHATSFTFRNKIRHGRRLRAHELVFEHGAVSAPLGEVLDRMYLMDPLAEVVQLRLQREVVAEGLALLLDIKRAS